MFWRFLVQHIWWHWYVSCSRVVLIVTHTSLTDFILGDAFLKNVYSVYDFGNWTEVGTGEPYMQILSVSYQLE